MIYFPLSQLEIPAITCQPAINQNGISSSKSTILSLLIS